VAREERIAKRKHYAQVVDTRGARVTASIMATDAGVRGRTVERWCGKHLWRRSIVVYVFLPEMKFSASLSSQILFVSRFAHGYRVWGRVH